MSLSIGLITRDAEHCLARALRSVMFLQTEIIVGDTGSKDSTVQLAKEFGAKTLDVNWQDDFAFAQNQVLSAASGDWILWLNPDEELLTQDRRMVESLLRRSEVLAYVVTIQEMTHKDQTNRFVETWANRLFRRRADLSYVGRLHPTLSPSLEQIAVNDSLQIARSDLLIRHHGYLSTLTEDKLRWSLRLLEQELRDRPDQLHYLIEMGRTQLRLNDPTGHETLARATELVRASKDAPVAPCTTIASLLEYLLTVSPEQSRSRLTREEAQELATSWFASSPPLLWLLAHQAFDQQRYSEAVRFLERLIFLGRSGTYDRSASFDGSILAEPAILNLGICYVRLGELDRAEQCFAQAMLSPTHQSQARQGYAMVQRARRDNAPSSS